MLSKYISGGTPIPFKPVDTRKDSLPFPTTTVPAMPPQVAHINTKKPYTPIVVQGTMRARHMGHVRPVSVQGAVMWVARQSTQKQWEHCKGTNTLPSSKHTGHVRLSAASPSMSTGVGFPTSRSPSCFNWAASSIRHASFPSACELSARMKPPVEHMPLSCTTDLSCCSWMMRSRRAMPEQWLSLSVSVV